MVWYRGGSLIFSFGISPFHYQKEISMWGICKYFLFADTLSANNFLFTDRYLQISFYLQIGYLQITFSILILYNIVTLLERLG